MAASQDERRPVMTKKSLFIAENPSVAQEFAKVLKVNGGRHDCYLETEKFVVTWPMTKNIKGGVLRPCLFCRVNLNMR